MSLSILRIIIIICISATFSSSRSIFVKDSRKTCFPQELLTVRRCLVTHGRALAGMELFGDEVLMSKMPQMNSTCHRLIACFDGFFHCDIDNILPATKNICQLTDFLAGDFVPCYEILREEKEDKCVTDFMNVMLGRNKNKEAACQAYSDKCILKTVNDKCGKNVTGRFIKMTKYMSKTVVGCSE